MSKNTWNEEENGFTYKSDSVDVFITRRGAHCAPVVFQKERGGFAPYFINPWKDENLENRDDPVLNSLRGNFFCLPFGAGGSDGNGRFFNPHGEVANGSWEFLGSETSELGERIKLKINPRDIGGTVTRQISVKDNILYTLSSVEGVEGSYPVGYHPNLRMPETGRMYVSNSPFETGRTDGQSASQYKGGEYYSLKPNADFTDMSKVPMINGGTSDCLIFPRLEGFVDIVAGYRAPVPSIAWSVAAYPSEGFLYFSLKNQEVFGTSLLWMEDKGRHQAPWNGRTRVLGLEDTCSFFANPVLDCRNPNSMSEKGYKTVWSFNSDTVSHFPYIEGTLPISSTFTKVDRVQFSSNSVEIISVSGERISFKVSLDFLFK